MVITKNKIEKYHNFLKELVALDDATVDGHELTKMISEHHVNSATRLYLAKLGYIVKTKNATPRFNLPASYKIMLAKAEPRHARAVIEAIRSYRETLESKKEVVAKKEVAKNTPKAVSKPSKAKEQCDTAKQFNKEFKAVKSTPKGVVIREQIACQKEISILWGAISIKY